MADDQYSDLSIRNLRSTMEIMKQATFFFTSNIFTLLILSLWIFCFRSSVEDWTELLTSIFDNHPSLKSQHDLRLYPRNPVPFQLHFIRLGTPTAGLFSSEHESDSPSDEKTQNGSSIFLHHFGPKFGAVDNGTQPQNPNMVRSDQNQEENNGTAIGLREFDNIGEGEENKVNDEKLIALIKSLPVTYISLIVVYAAMYSLAYGIVFHAVVSDLIGRNSSFLRNILHGSTFGLRRAICFSSLRWITREYSTFFLSLLFGTYDNLEDLSSLLKLLTRLKLIPLSMVFPWIHEFSRENPGFFVAWWLFDIVVEFCFALGGWITIVNTVWGFSGNQVIQESFYLLWSMLNHAIIIKCLEDLFCGSGVRFFFTRVFGDLVALGLQEIFEVYFMVVWLNFYLVAKCRDAANSEDRKRFGRKELNDVFESLHL